MRLKFLTTAAVLFSAILLAPSFRVSHAQNPVLKQRTQAPAPPVDQGRCVIDVVVTDREGHRVLGLGPQDFILSDNKQPQKLLTFSSVVQTLVKSTTPDAPAATPRISFEPAEVLLVVDSVNVGLTQQGNMREQATKYLRSNGGKLTAPTRLIFFTSAGIQVQNQPTLDGNALADLLEKIGAKVRVQNSAMGANGEVERFQLSVRNFSLIVENESRQPGRKLLLWLGPGWPLIENNSLVFNANNQEHNYDAIVSLLNRMREARMEVFSVRDESDVESHTTSMGNNERSMVRGIDTTSVDLTSHTTLYENYLNPVRKKSDADSADLSLQVLAIKSGGRVTDPSNDLAAEIARCVDDANSYYTLRYTPAESSKRLTYRAIDIKVNRPGLIARAIAGYYEAP